MRRFLYDELSVVSSEFFLSTAQSHHLIHVLRIKEGDHITVVDGRGLMALAEVLSTGGRTQLKLIDVKREENVNKVNVVFGITKSPAMDFLIRRISEVGVLSFQPLITSHSTLGREFRLDRWQRVIAEVCKQCEELHFPSLSQPLTLSDWVNQRTVQNTLIVCSESARTERSHLPTNISKVDLVIGPEGGWSTDELGIFDEVGALKFGLGRNRLRTETAALVAVMLVKNQVERAG